MAVILHRAFWEEFMELYKSMPCLWNVKCKEYRNKELKAEAYETLVLKSKEIYEEANRDFVTRKINNFRTSFRREYKKVQRSLQSGAVYEPTLWYYSNLLFLGDEECGGNLGDDSDCKAPNEEESDASILSVAGPYTASEPQSPVYEMVVGESHPKNSKLQKSPKKLKKIHHVEKREREMPHYSHEPDYIHMAMTPNGRDDEFDIIGRRFAFQLRDMDRRQRIIAEKIISDTMFHGRMGNLNECTTLTLDSSSNYTTHS